MLKCEHINLSLGGHEILRDVSLELKPGKFVAVLGPNGAGKSSLLKVMTGGWKADSGHVYAGSRRLADWDRKALSRRRSVLSQDSSLTFNFRTLEVVLMGRQPHHSGWETRRDYEIAGEALAAVDSEALAGRDYLTLSGGERQRVHLARALAQIWETPNDQDPNKERCLMLDEPLNNLDLAHQHTSLRIARKLSTSGVSVLAILHDINLAFEYADEIVLLAKGQQPRLCPTDPAAATESLSALFGWPLRVGTNPFTQKSCVFSQAV